MTAALNIINQRRGLQGRRQKSIIVFFDHKGLGSRSLGTLLLPTVPVRTRARSIARYATPVEMQALKHRQSPQSLGFCTVLTGRIGRLMRCGICIVCGPATCSLGWDLGHLFVPLPSFPTSESSAHSCIGWTLVLRNNLANVGDPGVFVKYREARHWACRTRHGYAGTNHQVLWIKYCENE